MEEVSNGLFLILVGYFKTLIIADRCAIIANSAFTGSALPSDAALAWLALYAFAFQVYADFSGYTDIARGVSKLFGFELTENFRAPYLVTNPAAFWSNWHISLSTWLRDYLYIPLGGNRWGPLITYRNLMITMLLGGLWHGAGWAFFFWGLYQGLLLVTFRRMGRRPVGEPIQPLSGWARRLAVLGYFHLTCLGWLIFRAGTIRSDVNQAAFVWNSLQSLIAPVHLAAAAPMMRVLLIVGGLTILLQWKHEALERFTTWQPSWQTATVAAALALITTLGVFDGAEFIYFQF